MQGVQSIWTIGHSSHEMPRFVKLLQDACIDVVADVRSQPFSRFNPHFNREPLRTALREPDIRYVFLGGELGGRPPESEFYDGDGHVLYGCVAETSRFRAGLERLLDGAASYRVAMMCSEEDPTNCHRRLLITRVLVDKGVLVVHLRGDGTKVAESVLTSADPVQPPLFEEEDPAWRSTRSVSRNTAPKASLGS
ncbi:MAG: DUF488 domain-containing protein [Actinobacteria bacterium]|nr:DUF488 domain-containing protein [Actinomycetota bacterium]